MSTISLVMAVLSVVQPVNSEDVPGATVIQQAMNEGVDLEFPAFQQLAAVEIRSGGVTRRKDFLFVCDAKLVWRLSHEEFKSIFRKAIERVAHRKGATGDLLKAFSPLVLRQLDQLGAFEKGQMVTKVRFRVRLERAGKDWIVTSSKLYEQDTNPLKSIVKKHPTN